MAAANSSARSVASQSLAAFAVLLVNITSGMGLGWPSPAWRKLTEPDGGGLAGPGFVLDVDEASWVVALYDAGIPLGAVLAALLVSSAGRRRTLMLGPALVVTSCALAAAPASTATALKAARVLHGMSFGIEMAVSGLYIGEMATSDMRGMLCSFSSSLVFVGVLIEYAIGSYVSFLAQALLPVPFALLSVLLLLLWVPESPYHLAARGRDREMRHALARLRGLPAGAGPGAGQTPAQAALDLEAKDILRGAEEDRRRASSFWRHLMTSAGGRRGCLIVLFLCGTGPMTGTSCLLAYSQYMFRATGSSLSPEISAISISSVQVLAGMISAQVVDRTGRRPLILVTAVCNAFAMAVASVFFFLKDGLGKEDAAEHVTWLPLVGLISFMVSSNLGTTTVPWVMMGELLPQQTKNIVPCMSIFCFSAVAFGINKLLPVLDEHVGLFLPFWMFGGWSIVLFVYTLYMVPETRGKTLIEVQALLRGEKTQSNLQGVTPEDVEDGSKALITLNPRDVKGN